MTKRASVESTAEAYLELLAARGVEYFFANSGTDFAPLIDAYAKRLSQGQALPRPMTIPHETPAVSMAHGYAMVTGRPQVVMVHVFVGAGNAVGGIINAARSNVPILFSAGRNPLTEAAGRDPLAVAALVRLAEALGAPVIDQFHTYVNFPQDHPLHAGFDATPYLDDADCVVAVESDVLWFPALKAPRPETKIVQIAVDPLFARYPIRGFPADAALSGTVSLNLSALAEAVRPRVDAAAVGERTQRWHAEHRRLRETWAATARKAQNEKPLEMVWVSKCVGDLVDDRTILVDEYDFD